MFHLQSQSETGFSGFRLGPSLQRAISDLRWSEPWAIQVQTIPAVLEGRDVLGLAQTGTGKTAAFALPILERMFTARGPGIRALVMAPTRELAIQIEAEFQALAKHTTMKTLTIYGGVSQQAQVTGLRRNPHIVVACPGRLLDLMGQGLVRLDQVETLVLDEADRLFDMGFLPDIRRIIQKLPRNRQNLLWSATMPSEIRRLADEVLVHPHVVELAGIRPASTIAHELYPVTQQRKLDLLTHLLSKESIQSAIVFTRTKHRAKRLAQALDKFGRKAVALQGNMSQRQRDQAMIGFRRGHFRILVATDIASRGIDVAQVSHVVNFDVPDTPEAYTHRIGRTGRAERSGKAYTFITPEDRETVDAIERTIGSKIQRRIVDGFGDDNRPSAVGVNRPSRQSRDHRSSVPRPTRRRWGSRN